MDVETVHTWMVRGVIALCPVVFLALLRVRAGYGRHRRAGRGPEVPARVAWVLMEAPTVALFWPVYLSGAHAWEPVPLALAALFEGHYAYRTLVYPLRIRPGKRGAAWWVVALGMGFQVVNTWLIATWLSHLGDYAGWTLADPRLVCGGALFGAGWWANLASDRILRDLRRPGETGYRVPHGGLFRWVSAPNYLGEIVEWFGFAVASWSWAGLAFALFTAANLVPRALAHHRWYQERFADYPRSRRAILPYLL